METLTGETLGHLIEERDAELSVEELAHLGLHLGSAVRYLHRHGVLHLDLKPSNVIAECGRAKLIDLSVARPPGPAQRWRRHARTTWRRSRRAAASSAPPPTCGASASVLFEAATGEPAFDDPEADERSTTASDESYGEAAYPQLSEPARRADELRAMPAEPAELIEACLASDPAARPSVQEVMDALEPLAVSAASRSS